MKSAPNPSLKSSHNGGPSGPAWLERYTPRGAVRHVFSMRKANEREQARFAPYFGL